MNAVNDPPLTDDSGIARVRKYSYVDKDYGVSMLISHQTFFHLQNSVQYAVHLIDRVKVKGKSEIVSVFEVFDRDSPKLREGKLVTVKVFEKALVLYNLKNWSEAEPLFQPCLRQNPGDRVA